MGSASHDPDLLTLDGRRWKPPGGVRRRTDAPTLVLLHEGLGSVGLWRDVPQRLAEATGCGVFAYSRFGYGQSDPVPLPRPMTYMHDEALHVLPRVLDAAGIRTRDRDRPFRRRFHRRDPCRRHPGHKRLRGLVLIAAHFFVEDLNIASIEQIRQTYEQGDLRHRLARHHRDVDVAFHGWNGAWLDPRFRAFDITEYLPRIRVPILALQGADDPVRHGRAVARAAAPRARAAGDPADPGARHSPHLEAQGGDAGRHHPVSSRHACRKPPHDRFPDRSRRAIATGSWTSTARSPR